jgi:hypothetical protein
MPTVSSFTNCCSISSSGVLLAAHSIKEVMLAACSRDNFVSARPERIIGMSAAAALSRLSAWEDGVVIIGIRHEFYRWGHAMTSDDRRRGMPEVPLPTKTTEKPIEK